jgi:multicomponent K+:H+ antiporter subunit D
MTTALDHLIFLPILLPLAAGALMQFLDDRQRSAKAIINVAVCLLMVVLAGRLVFEASMQGTDGELVATYPLGNWPVPFGIVLVADRLSAMMVLLTAILAIGALLFSLARWHSAGPSFHSLFQFLLMGLNGCFLTGDLFNLFVFFEVMLAASYGLALHGAGSARVKAGLHYIAVNLVASSLFLIGAAMLYGVTGTLNMADIAARVPEIVGTDRGLLEAGAAVLGVAFLVKAGMWPLGFWLPTSYSAASAPAAAIFAIMTKVGVYALLRLSLLAFGIDAGASAGFGQTFLLVGGMATIAFGAIGVLASQTTGRLAGYCVLISSGTLLAAIGMGDAAVASGALYYMVVSTLAISAFFLLVELLERVRVDAADVLAITMEAYGDDDEEAENDEIGLIIPATLAMLGVSFCICVLLLSSFPPLAGFLGKVAMISAMFNMGEPGVIPNAAWWLTALLIVSGFATLIALTRTGISTFWATMSESPARVRVIEMAPIFMLLGVTLGLTIMAGPVMDYMQAAAASLYSPQDTIAAILDAPLVPVVREVTP